MTLPTDIIFPFRPEAIKSENPADLERYMHDLIESLSDMYIDVAQNVNGSLTLFEPEVVGSVTAGTATYSRQTGWHLRQGLLVDIWFDIEWSGHTGGGFMILNLPYKAALTSNFPWMSALQSTATLTAGYTNIFVSANSNSTQGVILQSGSGVPYANVALAAAARLSGHLRYVGQEFEN